MYLCAQILASNVASPVPLPCYGLNVSVPEAYNNVSADGVDTVVIKQSNGLPGLPNAIDLLHMFVKETGVNTYDESPLNPVSQNSAAIRNALNMPYAYSLPAWAWCSVGFRVGMVVRV